MLVLFLPNTHTIPFVGFAYLEFAVRSFEFEFCAMSLFMSVRVVHSFVCLHYSTLMLCYIYYRMKLLSKMLSNWMVLPSKIGR